MKKANLLILLFSLAAGIIVFAADTVKYYKLKSTGKVAFIQTVLNASDVEDYFFRTDDGEFIRVKFPWNAKNMPALKTETKEVYYLPNNPQEYIVADRNYLYYIVITFFIWAVIAFVVRVVAAIF
jgi:hypothetical protein